METDRIVREQERRLITGRSKVSWWRDEQAGRVPKRVQIGPGAVGWRLSELLCWLQSLQTVDQPLPVAVPGEGKRRGRPCKVPSRVAMEV
ncbi:AlpA family phage regulatory protein [Geobacter sp. FeAm09]|nr:AlpA family phage regulatory protein [Geobacter sp. FeAm09]